MKENFDKVKNPPKKSNLIKKEVQPISKIPLVINNASKLSFGNSPDSQ